jgi:hypothetical protein
MTDEEIRQKQAAGTYVPPAYTYTPPANNEPQEQDTWLNSPYLMQNYTEEQRNAVKNFNPNEGLALEHYIKTFQRPKLDEQSLRKNRTLSAVGDSMKLLGQMFGAAKGVNIERLDPSQSLTSQNLSKEDELRKIYQNRTDEWNRGFYSALQHDRQTKNSCLTNPGQQMRADAKYSEAQTKADERYRTEKETEAQRYDRQQGNRDKNFAEQQKQNAIRNRQAAQQIAMQRERINADRAVEKKAKEPVPLRGKKGSIDIPKELWESIYPNLAVKIAGGTDRLPKGYMGKDLTPKEMELYVRTNIDRLGYGDRYEIKKAAGTGNPDGKMELPKGLMTDMQNIINSNPDNEDYTIEAIGNLLKDGGFSEEDAVNILNSIYTP